MRRLRAGTDAKLSPPGGAGAPPAGYYGLAARSWLTEVLAAPPEVSERRQGDEPNWREETDGGTEQPREARPGAGVRTPTWSAEPRSARAKAGAPTPARRGLTFGSAARRSAPSDFCPGTEKETATGRRMKPRGDDAWLFESSPFERLNWCRARRATTLPSSSRRRGPDNPRPIERIAVDGVPAPLRSAGTTARDSEGWCPWPESNQHDVAITRF